MDLDGRGGLRVQPNFTDTPGWVVLVAAEAQDLEGVVGKNGVDFTYQPGRRSRSWVKTAIRHAHKVVIVGWSPGSGNRHNSIGALLETIPCNARPLIANHFGILSACC